jgi:hypothetical protein
MVFILHQKGISWGDIQKFDGFFYSVFVVKVSQAKPPFKASPPPIPKLRRRIFHVVRWNVRVGGAEATRHGDSLVGGGGWGDLRIDIIR